MPSDRKLSFYTLPPPTVPYPFVLVNANNPVSGLPYIRLNRRYILSVIVDSGVEMFRDPGVKDYPKGWMDYVVDIYNTVIKDVPHGEVYVVVPDYPDDYHPGSLWKDGKDNVRRTLENIRHALWSYPEVRWIVPVQGHAGKPHSLVDALELYNRYDIPLDDYIAVANICTEKSDTLIRLSVEDVHAWLVENDLHPRVHVFGPKMSSVRKIRNIIHSFDTMAWTWPRTSGRRYATKAKERIVCFIQFLYFYSDVIQLPLGAYWNAR